MYMGSSDTISVISVSFTTSVEFWRQLKGFNKCIAFTVLELKPFLNTTSPFSELNCF